MGETGLIITFIFVLVLLVGFMGRHANEVDWGSGLSNVIDGLVRLLCRRYHRFQYQTIPLPESGGAIVAANHISGLDPLLIITACKRPVHFMIASEQYHRLGLTWLFRLAGCIPVERQGRSDRAFRAALKALDEGKVVALFPQGAIHHGHEPPSRLKRGVHKLAELSGAPVYPVHVSGVKGVGHVVRGVVLRGHARLESSDPINCGSMEHGDCLAQLAQGMKVHHH